MIRLITVLSLLFLISACTGKSPGLLQFEGNAQGTTYHISIIAADKDSVLALDIKRLLDEIDLSMSTYSQKSIISRMNENDTTAVADSMFTEVFNKSMEVSTQTDGAFDATVGPLVRFWGFGPEKFTGQADSSKVDSLLQLVGYKKMKLNQGRLVKEKPEMKLDFNAIAQGYSVDVVFRFLESKGIEHMMVEIGGELRTKGRNAKGNLWTVGIDRPIAGNEEELRKEGFQVVIQLKDKALATSGNYRKFYEKDGKKIAHTIDPKTGFPVQHSLLSATIVANDCMTADAFATAFMVMGVEEAQIFLAKNPEIQAYLIYADVKGEFKTFVTDGLKEYTQ